MRIVLLTRNDVDTTIALDGDDTTFTGTDEESGERVTFVLNDPKLAHALIGLAAKDGSVAVPLADFQVTSVEAVRGEWDSPGTSPEDGS